MVFVESGLVGAGPLRRLSRPAPRDDDLSLGFGGEVDRTGRRFTCIEREDQLHILVIGKEGQVARALSERASAHGAAVTLIGRPLLDLADPSGVGRRLAEISGDVIVNAAAYTAVDQAEAEPDLAEAINGIGAGAAAGAAAAMNVPFVQISTDYVFDGNRRPALWRG